MILYVEYSDIKDNMILKYRSLLEREGVYMIWGPLDDRGRRRLQRDGNTQDMRQRMKKHKMELPLKPEHLLVLDYDPMFANKKNRLFYDREIEFFFHAEIPSDRGKKHTYPRYTRNDYNYYYERYVKGRFEIKRRNDDLLDRRPD